MFFEEVVVHCLELLILLFGGFADLNALVLLLSRGRRLGRDVLMNL